MLRGLLVVALLSVSACNKPGAVMWRTVTINSPGNSFTSTDPVESFSTLEACKADESGYTLSTLQQLTKTKKPGEQIYAHHTCFPVGFDPRDKTER